METIITLFLVFLFFIYTIYAIVDVKKNKSLTTRKKWNFYNLIVLFPILGALIYYMIKDSQRRRYDFNVH
jgi:prolipoprotein diacylglyceryltransferase